MLLTRFHAVPTEPLAGPVLGRGSRATSLHGLAPSSAPGAALERWVKEQGTDVLDVCLWPLWLLSSEVERVSVARDAPLAP